MHSDDIKDEVKRLNEKADELARESNPDPCQIELLKVKADLLKTEALNELNWSFYYLKEAVKELNRNRR